MASEPQSNSGMFQNFHLMQLDEFNYGFIAGLRSELQDLVAAGDLDSAFTSILMDANSVGLRDELASLVPPTFHDRRLQLHLCYHSPWW